MDVPNQVTEEDFQEVIRSRSFSPLIKDWAAEVDDGENDTLDFINNPPFCTDYRPIFVSPEVNSKPKPATFPEHSKRQNEAFSLQISRKNARLLRNGLSHPHRQPMRKQRVAQRKKRAFQKSKLARLQLLQFIPSTFFLSLVRVALPSFATLLAQGRSDSLYCNYLYCYVFMVSK